MLRAMADCAFHPGTETLLSCSRCGRPACPECLVPMAVGQQCVGCVEGRPAAGEKGATRHKLRSAVLGADERGRLTRPAPLFYAIIAAFLALCLAAALMSDQALLNELVGEPNAAAQAVAISLVIVGAVLGLTLHEWAHAFVAYRGGDWSVRDQGYLTLDVRHYSHPVLSVGLPILFLLLGGLPLPGGAVWINTQLLRSKWWDSAVSLAGPTATVAFGLLLLAVPATGALASVPLLEGVLLFSAYIQFALAALNVLPIPGLDGYGILEPMLPDDLQRLLAPIRQWGIFIVLILLMNGALDFIWDLSIDSIIALGFDPGLVRLGYDFADPSLTD